MPAVEFRKEIVEENHGFLQATEFQIRSGKEEKSQKDETLFPTGCKGHEIPPLHINAPVVTMGTDSGRPQQGIARTGCLEKREMLLFESGDIP